MLLLGLESWLLLVSMEKTVEGEQTVFLQQIMGKRALWNMDGMWVKPVAGEVQEEVGMQLASTYIVHRKGKVAKWVEIHPRLKICTREKGY